MAALLHQRSHSPEELGSPGGLGDSKELSCLQLLLADEDAVSDSESAPSPTFSKLQRTHNTDVPLDDGGIRCKSEECPPTPLKGRCVLGSATVRSREGIVDDGVSVLWLPPPMGSPLPSDITRIDPSSPADSADTLSSGYASSDYRNYRHATLGPITIEQLDAAPEPRFWPSFAPASFFPPQNTVDIARHNPDASLPDYSQALFFPPMEHTDLPGATDYPRSRPQPYQHLPYAAPQSFYTEPPAADVPPHPMFLTHRAADMLGDSLTLAALSDARPLDSKPNYPYPTLIRAAILGSPRQALTLQGIYDALAGRYQWFRDHWQDRAWKNSIRHNLSLNKLFRRMARPLQEPGKGSYWTVDLSSGTGTKRERRRTSGRRIGLAQKARQAESEKGEPLPVRRTARRSSNRGTNGRDIPVRGSQGDRGLLSSPYMTRSTSEDAIIDPSLLNAAPPVPPPTPSVYQQAPMGLSQNAVLGGGHLGPAEWHLPPMARGPPTWGTPPSASASPAFGGPFPPVDDLRQCGAYPELPQMQWEAQLYHHGALAGSSETISTVSSLARTSASPVSGVSSGGIPRSSERANSHGSRRSTGSSSSSSPSS